MSDLRTVWTLVLGLPHRRQSVISSAAFAVGSAVALFGVWRIFFVARRNDSLLYSSRDSSNQVDDADIFDPVEHSFKSAARGIEKELLEIAASTQALEDLYPEVCATQNREFGAKKLAEERRMSESESETSFRFRLRLLEERITKLLIRVDAVDVGDRASFRRQRKEWVQHCTDVSERLASIHLH